MAHIHGNSFVDSFRLRAGNDLLKIWIVADRVPRRDRFSDAQWKFNRLGL